MPRVIFQLKKIKKILKKLICFYKNKKNYFFFKYCDRLDDILFLSSIIVGHDARLQLGELVPASLNANMANFLSFDVYDIDLKKNDIDFSKVMNDSNLNFIFLQMTSKSIIIVEDLD